MIVVDILSTVEPDGGHVEDLRDQAVEILTRAARCTNPDARAGAQETPIDFNAFLASVLAGVAANLRSDNDDRPAQAISTPPLHWKAQLATMTEPLVVHLNVPQLARTTRCMPKARLNGTNTDAVLNAYSRAYQAYAKKFHTELQHLIDEISNQYASIITSPIKVQFVCCADLSTPETIANPYGDTLEADLWREVVMRAGTPHLLEAP